MIKKLQLILIFALLGIFTNSKAQTVSESFDGTTFAPTGWTITPATGTGAWKRQAGSGTNPTAATHSGAGMALFNSFSYSAGTTGLLITPAIDYSCKGSATPTISFWMFRDNGSTNAEKLDVYVNTAANATGAILLGTINRSSAAAPTATANTWNQYTFNIPASFSGATNYIVFKGTSAFGNNIFIDDVSYTTYPAGNMTYSSSAVTQANISTVAPGSTNQQVIGVTINNTGGACNPNNATSFTFNTNGTTATATDITNAKLYYTAGNNSFAATGQFGTTVAAPNGIFTITGSQALISGANYFWLSYDIPSGATLNNFIDGECTSIDVGGATVVPSPTTVAGNRKIANPTYCNSTFSSGCSANDDFTNVTLLTINNTTMCGSAVYPTPVPDVNEGGSYTLSVKCGITGDYVNGWIDYNNDGTFSASEQFVTNLASSTTAKTTPLNIQCGFSGTKRIRLTISLTSGLGACGSATYGEQEDYFINIIPITASAGADQTLCANSATFAGNNPSFGNGTWTLISGSGTITTPASYNSTVSALGQGANTFRWTVTNGSCSNYDDVIITNNTPTTSNAGPDQNLCNVFTATLAGNAATVGMGAWTLVSGSGTVTTPSSPTSAVTGLALGANTFRWTITNVSCTSLDDIVINVYDNPTMSNAGPDQPLCATIATLAGNTPTVGTGMWTVVSGTSTVTTPSSPTSGVTGLGFGANTFRWTISNGSCTALTDDITITRDMPPTTSNAGPDQNFCSTSTATLAGNTPTVGTGLWTLISGAGTLITPSSETSGVTALGFGANVFRWTISNGTCTASTDDVTITRDDNPTVSNAGPDAAVCTTTATLAANNPTVGTGSWTVVSGGAVVTTPANRNSGVTGLAFGANVFRWTISNGTCTSSTDDITITRDMPPTTSAAGPDQTICATTGMLAANNPTIGTGMWTVVTGTATVTNPTQYNSGVTGLVIGSNVFRWTITNGSCASSADDIQITRDNISLASNAGPDQTLCSTNAVLAANTPAAGTGTWSVISGTGTFTNPNSPSTSVTGLSLGDNVFQWQISNGTCTSSDNVKITRDTPPTTSNAGPDQTLCASTAILAANTPVVGTGMWSVISGSATVNNPSDPNSGVSGLAVGVSTFRWTISNGTCSASTDNISITRDNLPTTANAGADQQVCDLTTTLAANTPTVGTGLWTVIAGSGTVTSPANPSSGVTGLSVGTNTFRWTTNNGTCSSSTDDVDVSRYDFPTSSNAGTTQNVCDLTATLAANTPTVGTGMWSVNSGGAIVTDPTNPNSGVTGLDVGNNIFTWTISNGVCTPSTSDVTINRYDFPTASNAGSDQTVCDVTGTLSANTPAVGTGVWSVVTGGASLDDVNDPNSGVSGLTVGINTFRWTISNGNCTPTTDDVTINRDDYPTVSAAGPDQEICVSTATLSGNAPTVGTGIWTVSAGSGIITNATNKNTTVTGLSIGSNKFVWTISNGVCSASTDEVEITVDDFPTVANAGTDQTVCGLIATLSANTPVTGTGIWTVVSGGATVDTPAAINSTVSNLAVGNNVFRWTISNGTCASSSNDVTIKRDDYPTTANAGPDQTVCTSTATLAGNSPAVGTGTWSIISGGASLTAASNKNTAVTGLTTGNNVFRWTVSNGVCASSTDDVTINLLPSNFAGTASPANQQVCQGTTVTLNVNGNIGNIQWQDSSSTTGWANVSSATSTSLTFATVSTKYYRVKVSNASCVMYTNIIAVRVSATSVAGSAGADQVVCTGTNATINLTGYTGTIQWQTSPDKSIIRDSVGQTSATLVAKTAFDRYYRAKVTNGVCAVDFSGWVKITVTPVTIPGKIASSQQLCVGDTARLAVRKSRGTLQWQSSADNISFADEAGETDTIIKVHPATSTYYRVIVTNGVCPAKYSDTATVSLLPALVAGTAIATDTLTCGGKPTELQLSGNTGNIQWQQSADGNSGWVNVVGAITAKYTAEPTVTTFYRAMLSNTICSSKYSNTVKIHVLPGAYADSVLADRNTLCYGSGTSIKLKSHTGTIQWQQSADALNWNDIASASQSTYVTGTLQSNIFYRAILSVGTCTDTSTITKVTVVAAAYAGVISQNDTVCEGSAYTVYTSGSLVGNLQWKRSSDGLVFTDVTNAKSSSLTVTATISSYYKLIADNGQCTDSTKIVYVKVISKPTVGVLSASQTLCTGTSTIIKVAGVSGTVQWQSSVNNVNFIDVTNAGNTPELEISPLVNTFYRVQVSKSPCTTLTSNVILISVTQGSVGGTVTSAKDTLCEGQAVNLALNGYTGNIQWQKAATPVGPWTNITNATRSTYSEIIINPAAYRTVLTNNTCPSVNSNTVQIRTVTGVEAGSIQALSDTICINDNTQLSLNNSIGKIQWQTKTNNQWVNITGAVNAIYTIPNISSSQLYRAIVYNGQCTDSTAEQLIFTNSPPEGGNALGIKTICKGNPTTITLQNSAGNVQWQQSSDNIHFADINGEINTDITVKPAATNYYKALLSRIGCTADPSSVCKITVVDEALGGVVYCEKVNHAGIESTINVKDYRGNIQWQQSADSITFTDMNGEHSDHIMVAPAEDTYYRIVASNDGCAAESNVYKYIVEKVFIRLSPVPAKDNININFYLVEPQELTLKVYDMLGQLLIEKPYTGIVGNNTINLDIHTLSVGIHHIVIVNTKGDIREQFIKAE